MGKTLKIGFAMGGGVSLGTFSGASLTETIKLAVLYGTDEHNVPYDKIEVDVFSGASAGAMSLGVMLKALAFPTQDVQERKKVWASLKTTYNLADNTLPAEKKEQLIDAELAQQMMNQVWVHEINLDRLLNPEPSGRVPALKHQAGLCNKAAVTDIAKQFMTPPKINNNAPPKTSTLLAARVLYGCSISNLNPIKADARDRYLISPHSDTTAGEALISNFHREQRIFDINFSALDTDKFDNQDIHPKRWMRFHWGESQNKKTFDIRKREEWNHIVATAIASGAFPVAFEPVPLVRYRWEYPANMWEFKNQSHYVFTYMDGGAFTNSPVAEAFNLAAHIDGIAPSQNQEQPDYDRRIIFVDPFVNNDNNFNLKGFKTYKDQMPFGKAGKLIAKVDGNDLLKLTSLDKLLPNAFNQFGAIYNQAEAKHSHRNFQIANKLVMRNMLRECLHSQVKATKKSFESMRANLQALLIQFSNKALIPTLPANLANEIERLAQEQPSSLGALKGQGIAVAESDWGSLNEELRNLGMTAMIYSYIDLIADIEAKSRNKRLIAIGPFRYKEKQGEVTEEPIFLPGAPLAGFAGFMSTLPSEYEVEVARFCTFQMLQSANIIDKNINAQPVNQDPQGFKDQDAFLIEYKNGLRQLSTRVDDLISDSHLLNVGWFNPIILGGIKSFLTKAIEDLPYHQESEEFEFRIEVASKKFELDARHWQSKDRGPVWLEETKPDGNKQGAFFLVCFASRNWHVDDSAPTKEKWSGYYLKQGKLPVEYDGWWVSGDEEFIAVDLPSDDLLEQARMLPNPIFYSKTPLKKSTPPESAITKDFWQLKNVITPYTDLL
jgi:predicted acylesterase/phospholipase RssA